MLSPENRNDAKACDAEPTIGDVINSKESANNCHADSCSDSDGFTRSPLGPQKLPSPLRNHQALEDIIGIIKLPEKPPALHSSRYKEEPPITRGVLPECRGLAP
jgi:hypothetical protein